MSNPDIEAIRQSPRQYVDLETVEALSDYAMILEQQVAAKNQDAARYAWLRKSDSSKPLAIAEWSNEDGEWIILGFKPEYIDAAIDRESK